MSLPAEFNPNAPIYSPKTFEKRGVSETCPTRPPDELLVGTLTQEWGGASTVPEDEGKRIFTPGKKKSSIGEIIISTN